MKKKKAIVLAAVILIAALTIYFIIYFVKKERSLNELTLFGNIEIRTVDLSFQVGGNLEQMFFEEGDTVNQGDLIAILDARDYKANYDKAIADTEQAKALSNNAVSVYNRKMPLCADDTVSKEECDTITKNKDMTKADYDAKTAQRDYAKNQLDYTKLYAPCRGVVSVRVQEPGASVAKNQIIYTVNKSDPVWIRTYVNEKDLGNIAYGMKARILTDSKDPQTGKKREYTGWIGYISPVAEFTPKIVQTEDLRTDLVYRIRVYVDKTDEFLRQGMPTTVKINLKEKEFKENVCTGCQH